MKLTNKQQENLAKFLYEMAKLFFAASFITPFFTSIDVEWFNICIAAFVGALLLWFAQQLDKKSEQPSRKSKHR